MKTIVIRVMLLGLMIYAPGARAAERMNVVVILADDLGWADLGCYGSTYHRTPNLDRFAKTGARFTNAYAAASICSPSRAALLTGKYPARYNLTDWLPGRSDRPDQKLLRPTIARELAASEVTLAALLKRAGYRTGHFGKWHLGGDPQKYGFDVSIGNEQRGGPRSFFAPFKGTRDRFLPGLEQAADGEYLTDRLTAEAEKFIETSQDRPFFVYLAHYAVHIPLMAKPAVAAKYKQGRPGEQGNPLYAGVIESLDDSVGRILKKLDQLNLAERTIVVFMSDNGGLCVIEGPDTPATINAPLREGKGYLYEGGLRVPLLMRWPGVTMPGGTILASAHGIDLFPTLLEGCGLKSGVKADGVSLAAALKGEAGKRDLYWHYPHYSNQGGKPGAAIRSGDFKLIEFYENGRRELYNLARDVGEIQNLAESDPGKVKELTEKLDAWRKEAGARMMKPNPDYTPSPQGKDGNIVLAATTAEVHGVMLRYEPLPHKNTLGFWVRPEDWVSWEFTVMTPGMFRVDVLQGCGKGQGGSEVDVAVGNQIVGFTVEDTGHFQNFKLRNVGRLHLDRAGRHTLTVRAKKLAAGAVMDLRSVTLTKVAN